MTDTDVADVPDVPPADWIRGALERFEGPLLRYALRYTGGDLDSARDIVQETFLGLCRADRAEVEDRLAAWLFMVCRNRAIDARRKERRMMTLDMAVAEAYPSHEPAPSAVAEERAAYAEVLEALAVLPGQQQEVIRLKFQNGLSYAEISQVTGLSVTNVGYSIHMGIKALRQRLQPDAAAAATAGAGGV